MGRVKGSGYSEGYYFYSPQSSTVKVGSYNKITNTNKGFAHPKYACTAGYYEQINYWSMPRADVANN